MRVLVCALVLLATTHACPSDCSGHGECTNEVCTCEQGWAGADCSVYDCTAHVDGCSGHGQCRGTTCVCHDGYGGSNCASVVTNCPFHCKGHGSCLDGECTCDNGYTGLDCGTVDSSVSCPQNCSGHGFCDLSGDSPSCYCMPSFSGEACDVEQGQCPSNLNNCTGHGICTSDPDADIPTYTCACEAGFCGDTCNQACPSCLNNCTGHGMCLGSQCQCDAGFGGDDCSSVEPVDGCPNHCSGHGRCLEGAGGVHSCVCADGFAGESCVLVVSLCPGNCSGKGECMTSGRCACMPGYNGSACEIAMGTCAASNNCSSNGQCINGVCSCYPGFRGTDCSEACHVGGIGVFGCFSDQGHGVCVNGTCVCKDGEWEGSGCEIQVHDTTLGAVASSNNPVGIIVISVLGAAIVLLLAGYAFNYARGKRGLKAVPGASRVSTSMKGDDYEDAPENRYASNY